MPIILIVIFYLVSDFIVFAGYCYSSGVKVEMDNFSQFFSHIVTVSELARIQG